MSHHLYKAYSRATHTVGKTQQVVMLYDGVIRFLSQSRDAMEKGDVERRFKTLTRAGEIITGLQSCLDFDTEGTAAQTLHDFYTGIDMRILQLHRTQSIAECQKVIDDLKAMREVWSSIDRANATAQAPLPQGEALAGQQTVSA